MLQVDAKNSKATAMFDLPSSTTSAELHFYTFKNALRHKRSSRRNMRSNVPVAVVVAAVVVAAAVVAAWLAQAPAAE